MINNKDELDNLIEYCRSNNRIIPTKWTQLWEMLPGLKRRFYVICNSIHLL